MKSKYLIFFLFQLFFFSSFSQNHTKFDKRFQKEILIGTITLDAFQAPLCKKWYQKEYQSYRLKKKLVKKLKRKNQENLEIKVVLGSWCHDTHREVPRLIKILDEIDFPLDKLSMNALDSKKESPDFDANYFKIKKIPTIIVYRNHKEIGRIIETPKKCLERDLIRIFSKK